MSIDFDRISYTKVFWHEDFIFGIVYPKKFSPGVALAQNIENRQICTRATSGGKFFEKTMPKMEFSCQKTLVFTIYTKFHRNRLTVTHDSECLSSISVPFGQCPMATTGLASCVRRLFRPPLILEP